MVWLRWQHRPRKTFARRHHKAHRVEREPKFLVKGGSDPVGFDVLKSGAGRPATFNLIKSDQEPPLENVERHSVHIVVAWRNLANGIPIILVGGPEVELISQSQVLVRVQLHRPIEQNVAIDGKPKTDIATA